MRTRTSWLAWVLTLGMALAPAAAWGQHQEVPFADPQIPWPLGHDRLETGGPFLSLRALLYHQTNPLRNQAIAQRGLVDFDGSITAQLNGRTIFPPNSPPVIIPGIARPGTFVGSGAVALRADDVGSGTYQPGLGLTAGWRFQNGVTVEVDYWQLFEAKYATGATLVPPGLQPGPLLTETFLFAPVHSFPIDYSGPAQKVALGNPNAAYGIWNGASLMEIDFVQRTTGVDITTRWPWYQDDCVRCYGLIGPRFVWMWERFKWRTVSYDTAGIAGPDDQAIYTNIVSNRMYGLSMGVGTEWYLKHGLSLSLDVRFAPLIDVVKERARYQRADKAIASKNSRTEYQFVPEVQGNLNLWWYPTEGIQMRFGYDIMAFFNTISSKNPVSFNYSRPDPSWDNTTRLINGINAGIAFIF